MEKEGDLYIDILNWAYERVHNGFTSDELRKEFKLEGERWDWALKIFFPDKDNENSLIKHITYKADQNLQWYAISSKGISAVINERQLKEARDSSRKAIKIATYSLWIAIGSFAVSIIVNIAQIIVQVYFR